MDPTVVLLTLMQVPPHVEEEFNAWYETEHVMERLSVKGFLSACRFRALDNKPPKYLTLYDVENETAFEDQRYQYLKGAGVTPWTRRLRNFYINPSFVRTVYRRAWPDHHEPTSRKAAGVLLVAFSVDNAHQDEFTQWHDGQFLPALLALPSFFRARRLVAMNSIHDELTVVDLADVRATESEDYSALQQAASSLRHWAMVSNHSERVFEAISSSYAEGTVVESQPERGEENS